MCLGGRLWINFLLGVFIFFFGEIFFYVFFMIYSLDMSTFWGGELWRGVRIEDRKSIVVFVWIGLV